MCGIKLFAIFAPKIMTSQISTSWCSTTRAVSSHLHQPQTMSPCGHYGQHDALHAHRAVLAYHIQDCSSSLRHLDLHGHARDRGWAFIVIFVTKNWECFESKNALKFLQFVNWCKNFPKFHESIKIFPGKKLSIICHAKVVGLYKSTLLENDVFGVRLHTLSASRLHKACNFNCVPARETAS